MLGFSYLTPREIAERHAMVQAFLDEEGASPIITSGRGKNIVTEWVKDKNAKILDCAPGTGLFLEQLTKEGYTHLYGADIDNYLHDDVKAEFKAVDVCMQPLPWPDHFFDVVTSFETVEHLENPYHFVREMHRVLKPGGVFILSMPNVQHIFNRIFFFRKGDMPRWRKNNNHLGIFPKGVFHKLFLRSFDAVHTGYFWGFFPWRFLSKLSFWPANEKFAHTVYYVFKPKELTN